MIRIFVNLIPNYLIKSTDYIYLRNYKRTQKELGVDLYFPKSKLWGIRENVYAIINKILNIFRISFKIKYKYPKEILGSEYSSEKFDIIYSQSYCPINTIGKPVFLESGFWEPGQNSKFSTEAAIHFQNFTIPYIKKILAYPCIINLKSDKEIENAKKYFPGYEKRFVNLPFILPDLKSISEAECKKKHKNKDVIKLLFVGGEAKRKGLSEVLQAYMKFKTEYPDIKTEFNIVSGFNDGNITIPKDDSIKYHGKLSYTQTQELMKSSHIFIMVSERESYGWVYIEAMAQGCVVIARDYYPQKEFLNFGECGILAIPNDMNSINSAIKKSCMMSGKERCELAIAALNKFKSDYSVDVVIPKYKELFKTMVKG